MAVAGLLIQAGSAYGAPADDSYAQAASHYAASQWSEAADAFGRFLDLHPDHERASVARFFRGEALAQTGDYEASAAEHDKFLIQAPAHTQSRVARFRTGECLLLAGKYDEAKVRLEAFRREHPADELNAFALAYLGEIALAAGEAEAAQKYYEQSLKDYPAGPMMPESRFGLARCLQLTGKLDEAVALYERVAMTPDEPLADDARLQIGLAHYEAKQFAAAEESLSAFRTTFADSDLAPQAWYWLGLSQTEAGRPAEAAATLSSAAKQYVETSQASALHAAAGDAFRRAKDTAQADWHYQQLLEKWPQSDYADEALLSRVELALQAGELQRADALAAELARRYPDSPHAAVAGLIRARGLLAENKFAEAEALLRQMTPAAADSAGSQQAAYLLAVAQIGLKKHEAALQSLEKLTALPKDHALTAAVEEARCSALLGLERYDEALALLQTLLTANSVSIAKSTALRVQLVVALVESDKLAEAVREAEQLPPEALHTSDGAAAVLLAAEGAYKASDYPKAEKLFALATGERTPAQQRMQALSGLAWTQHRSAGKGASAATFERLLREYPDSPLAPEAAVVRARTLEEARQYDAALATYRLVIDQYSDSSHLPAALWGAARLHDQLNQDREAAELLKRLVDEHPQIPQYDAVLYELGWVLADLQDHPAAEAAHRRLVEEYAQSEYFADAAYHLAQQAARRKETTQAIELTDQVLASKTGAHLRESALYLRGQLAAAEARWDEVARFMGQHVEQFPASAMNLSARYWQAEAAFRQGDYAAAEKQLAALESGAQSRTEAWLGIVPLRRAQCLAQQKRWPEALRLAESIAKRYPQFKQQHEADYLVGRALGSQARFDEARAAYDRVLQSPAAAGSETAAMAQWMIGETYFHQKRYTEAITAYERCVREHTIGQWQAASLLQAGKCRLLIGESEQARSDLERVVTEFADQPLAAEAKTRLEALGPPRAASANSLEKPR